MLNAENKTGGETKQSFLPDLCSIKTLLTVIIMAQLLAFVLVLAAITQARVYPGWDNLGFVSMFVQWIALTSIAILCLLRKPLAKMTAVKAGIASYLLILLITFVMSMLLVYLGKVANLYTQISWGYMFALRNMLISAIVSAIALRFIYLHYLQTQTSKAQSMARIQALQARIRPHFLFNSMNTIAALIKTQPQNAEQAVEDLAELFRSSLGEAHQMVSLESELERVKRYLRIESLRLGERLKVQWELDSLPALARLPPLVLQPLFENAVYHGIEPLAEGGLIKVKCSIEENIAKLVIENPIPKSVSVRKQGSRIAMDNIRERLTYTFGSAGQLFFVKKKDSVSVILLFPLTSPGHNGAEKNTDNLAVQI